MKKSLLREYAKLIVRMGVNIQKGQDLLIYADLDQPEFVQMVVEEAYKAKAREVTVFWSYQPMAKVHNRYQSLKTMSTVHEWQKARQELWCETLPARLHIISEDPDGLKGMNMEKASKARQKTYPIMKPYIEARDGKQQWSIAAVPGAAWAKKLFPNLSKKQAMEKLWEAILLTARVCDDSVQAWKDHNADLEQRCAYLADRRYCAVH